MARREWVEFAGGLALKLLVFGVLSFGFLYFSYKFYVPWRGGNDYAEYYHMVQKPFDFTAARAPFVYRQVGTAIAHVPWRLGLRYPTDIALDDALEYKGDTYPDTRVFFALVLTNYVFLVLTAVLLAYFVRFLTSRDDPPIELLAGTLVFFSFSTLPHLLTGLTDALTWFLLTAALFAYMGRNLPIVVLVLVLSIWQREVLPLVVAGIAAADALFFRHRDRFVGVVFGGAILAFLTHLFVRAVWIPVEGYPTQLSPGDLLSRLFSLESYLSRSFLMETMMSQNIIALMLLALWARIRRAGGLDDIARLGIFVVVGDAVLLVLSQAAGANTGRLLSMLHPAACVVIATSLSAIGRAPTAGRLAAGRESQEAPSD
jgi:hypothetical protein